MVLVSSLDVGTVQWLRFEVIPVVQNLPHQWQGGRNNIEWPVERNHILTAPLMIPVKARHPMWLVRIGQLEIPKAPPHLFQASAHNFPLSLDHDWLDDAEAMQWPTSVVSECQQMSSKCGDMLERDLLDCCGPRKPKFADDVNDWH